MLKFSTSWLELTLLSLQAIAHHQRFGHLTKLMHPNTKLCHAELRHRCMIQLRYAAGTCMRILYENAFNLLRMDSVARQEVLKSMKRSQWHQKSRVSKCFCAAGNDGTAGLLPEGLQAAHIEPAPGTLVHPRAFWIRSAVALPRAARKHKPHVMLRHLQSKHKTMCLDQKASWTVGRATLQESWAAL